MRVVGGRMEQEDSSEREGLNLLWFGVDAEDFEWT